MKLGNFQKMVVNNSPTIFMVGGIATLIGSGYLGIRGTLKSKKLLEESVGPDDEWFEVYTKKEIVQKCWKNYVPTVATLTIGTAMIIGANNTHIKRSVLLTSAAAVVERNFEDLKDVVKELPTKTQEEIKEKVATKRVASKEYSEAEVIRTNRGETACYDPWSDRYFKCDILTLERGIVAINEALYSNGEMYCTLNDFYDSIGLKRTIAGDILGWNMEYGSVDKDFIATFTDDGLPAICLGFTVDPRGGFERWR